MSVSGRAAQLGRGEALRQVVADDELVYFVPPGGPIGNNNPGFGALLLAPFDLPRRMRIIAVALEVTTAGGAGTFVRAGLYRDNGKGTAPRGLPIVDAGQLAATAGFREAAVDVVLDPGRWWAAAVTQGDNLATRPFLRVLNTTPLMGFAAAVAFAPSGYQLAGVDGALPELPEAFVRTAATAPRMYLKGSPA